MRTLSCLSSVLLGFTALFGVASAAVAHVARDGSSPALPFDPNTTSFCTWWVDLTAPATCASVISENAITLEQFQRWNPSLASSCSTLQVGRSYCVEAFFEPPPASTTKETITSTTSTTSTTPPPASTTKPSNGITTPLPTQPTIVDNCDAFYLVKSGDTCDSIIAANRITLSQLLAWNPSAGASCAGLWANAYACISIIGVDPSPTSITSTSTITKPPGNGVTTPLPTQIGMVTNCNKFHFVQGGQTCATIAALYSIPTSQFVSWNPAAGTDCSGLWASTYACVGVIGQTPTVSPTPTSSGNGIATPTPTQPGMVGNCKKFAFVNPGSTCDSMASANRITVDQFVAWNTGVGGRSCTGLWANVYACVGI